MLTDTEIRKSKPTGKAFRLFDAGGLYVEVSPAGGKLWRLKYRFVGKEKRLALGLYPAVSLADAREKRDAARAMLAKGVDPSAQRRAERALSAEGAANTLSVVAREWYEKQAPTWAPAHASRVWRRLEKDVLPYLGERPIGEITAPDVLRVLRRVESRVVETAHRARVDLSCVFRYAVATGRCDRDPAADVKGALAPVKGSHFAAVVDPNGVGPLLRMLWAYQGTPVVGAAVKLGPMLAVRPGELRHMRWEHVDLDAAEWRFTTSKTGLELIVPLAPQAVEILKELQPLTGRSPFVFPSARANDRPMSEVAVLAAYRRMGIGKETACGHGWRATFRTLLDEVLGVRPDLIEAQLGHAVKDPNGRAYNRTTFLDERRKIMATWADYLDKLRADVKVLPFAREAKTAG